MTQNSPVLVLRVYELVLHGSVTLDVVLNSTQLDVQRKEFKLAGMTLHQNNHYCSIIYSEKHGPLWYDGLVGVLKPFKETDSSWTPSHVVYCLV